MDMKTQEKMRRAGLAHFAVYVALLELTVATQEAAQATDNLGKALRVKRRERAKK